MKPELCAAAMAAIDALIADELAGTAPGRYANMAKLCGQADRIRQMAITRVADVGDDEQADDYIGALGYDAPIPIPRLRIPLPQNPMQQAADLARTISDTINRRPAPSTAEQLEQMVRVRESMLTMHLPTAQLAPIDDRIAVLTATLSKENTDATTEPADHSDVVPAQLLRGHPAQGDVGELVRRNHVGGDSQGARRALGAGEAREGGRLAGSAEPRDDHDAGHDEARGAYRRGSGEAGHADAPGPRDDLGGPVQGRDDGGGPNGRSGMGRRLDGDTPYNER